MKLLTSSLPLFMRNGPRLLPTVYQCSTQAQTQSSDSFRTLENSPQNHSSQHLSRFYRISPEDKAKLFLYGGITKSYETQLKTFTETCLMVRPPALEVIDCLRGIDYAKPLVKFVLYGKKGVGKTLTLAHVLHYAAKENYLLVHVPWVGNWMRRCKEKSASETREGYVNLNLDAAAWLIHFKNQNSHFLTKPEFTLSKDYVWTKREMTAKGAPLAELIDHGVNRVKFASECVVALAEEIKLLSTNGVCRTLVAVDGFNAFYYPNTRIFGQNRTVLIHPSKVTLTEAFISLTRTDWTNGAAVLIVDEMAIAEPDQISHLPRYLLSKDGFDHLDPFVPILVKEYSETELQSCMDYYRERKWIQSFPGIDEEVGFLSAKNPYRLMQLCNSL